MNNFVDPHKIGGVMWSSHMGLMIPHELHERVTDNDARNLHTVFGELMLFRKVEPALMSIRNLTWDNIALVKPYLQLSIRGRSGARKMIAEGDWDPFWSSLY